jgi:hypothetical protein
MWIWPLSGVRKLRGNFIFRFPTVEQGLILEQEAEKKHSSERARCQQAIGEIYFTKK